MMKTSGLFLVVTNFFLFPNDVRQNQTCSTIVSASYNEEKAPSFHHDFHLECQFIQIYVLIRKMQCIYQAKIK